MDETKELSFDRLLDVLAERLAVKLCREPSRFYPRLLTVEQAAVYLGQTRQAVQEFASSGKLPTVRADRQIFLDRQDLDQWIADNKTGWV